MNIRVKEQIEKGIRELKEHLDKAEAVKKLAEGFQYEGEYEQDYKHILFPVLPKFGIHQDVFILANNKIVKKTVRGIYIHDAGYTFIDQTTIDYDLADPNDYYSKIRIEEKFIFSSQAKLAEKFLKENVKDE